VNRRTAAVLILLAWAGALGWLVQRHYFSDDTSANGPRWPVPPGSAFLAIRLGERQIGLASVTVDTLPHGLRVVELQTVDLPAAPPDLRRTSLRIESLYTRALQLRSFQVDLLTERGRDARTGRVEGDTLLTVVDAPQGQPAETLRIALRRPIVRASAVPLVAASRGLPQARTRLNVEVFDPIDEELRVDRFTVAAESLFAVPDSAEFNPNLRRWTPAHSDTVRAWRLDGMEQGLPVHRWFDAAGMIVLTRHPFGATLERSAFELVQTNFRAAPPPLWDTSAAAPSYRPAQGRATPRSALAVVARLAPPGALARTAPALEGGWQSRASDTLRVAPPDAMAQADSEPDTLLGPVWSLARRDTALAQTAARILRREARPQQMATALNAWVGRTITLRGGPGTAPPLRTLAAGRGSAVERVLLLVGLARSAGLPARSVWGVVLAGGRWQLGTWAEIWAGTWLPMDPALRGRGTDAGRLRLGTGGSGRLLDLALRAGRLRFEVLEEKR
jgi:Transglutaminase-like superfamily